MRLRNLTSLGVSAFGTGKFISVCAHRTAPPELILSGLYRTVDGVSGLDGIAMRFIDGKRCAVIFLAGMPKQDFRCSVETEFTTMVSFTDPGGFSCYRLSQAYTLEAQFKRASRLARLSGGRLPNLSEAMGVCVSGGRVVLKIGTTEFQMRKISDDPHHTVEPPLEPPDPGKYVNERPVSGLGGLVLTVAANRRMSVEIVLPDGTTQEYCRGSLQAPSTQHRCFEFVNPKLRLRTDGLAAGHFLTDLVWYDIQLCRDSKAATYLVFDKVKVRLEHEGTDLYERRTEATRTDEPSGHQLALSGLYRTTGSVSVFNGMALRFAEGKCAIVFLAGMPEQDFRYSISTEFSRMQPSTTRGLTCYKLNNKRVRDDLHRANTLQMTLGGPGNLSPDTVFPCDLDGAVLLMVGGSTYSMQKVSGDPYEPLELPLTPPPGVYVHDHLIPGLDGVTVAIGTDGSFSAKVAITGGANVTLRGRTLQREGSVRRCFRDATPHVQSIAILLAAREISTKLILDDVKLCRDPRLVTYVVFGDMAVRLRTTSHPENPANKIQPGMHVKKASTKGRVLGQDKPPIPHGKPTEKSSIGVARQGRGNFPDIDSLMPSSVTRRRTPGPREGSSRTSEEGSQLRVRQGEAAAWNPGPKRESLVGVASAAGGSYLDIGSLLPLPVMKRPPSRPTHEGFPRASGNAGKIQVLREGEPSALRDGSGGKSSVIGPGSSESGNRPEFHLLLPSLAESRSNVKSGDATRPHKIVSGRGVGPVENLLASLEGGWLVKPSTHPPRSRSVAMKAGANGARASKRQKTSHAASISRRLTENEPGEVIPLSEDTGEHGSEKTDLGPNTPAVTPRESASGGGHGGFGYFHKVRSPNRAKGNPSGSSQVRSLGPSDEESNLETQLSIFDSETPELSPLPSEDQGVGIDPDFDAFFVPSNVTWSDLLSPEPGVSVTAPSGAGEEPRGLSIDEQLAIEDGGLLDFLDPDKQWKWS